MSKHRVLQSWCWRRENRQRKEAVLNSSPFLGRTLVEHAARTALASGASEVIVVVGKHVDEIRRRLKWLPVRVIHNREWTEGISSSIRAGISGLRSNPTAAVLYLCDQSKVTPQHLSTLGQRAIAPGGPSIVASAYDGVVGVPCAFAAEMFPRLLALQGKSGARDLVRSSEEVVETIRFADANKRPETPGSHRPKPERTYDTVKDFLAGDCDSRASPGQQAILSIIWGRLRPLHDRPV